MWIGVIIIWILLILLNHVTLLKMRWRKLLCIFLNHYCLYSIDPISKNVPFLCRNPVSLDIGIGDDVARNFVLRNVFVMFCKLYDHKEDSHYYCLLLFNVTSSFLSLLFRFVSRTLLYFHKLNWCLLLKLYYSVTASNCAWKVWSRKGCHDG